MVIRSIFVLALLALTTFPASALTQLQASVDSNPIMEGETLVLTVTADDDINSGKLDTSALLKDFMVGRTSISRSKKIMNFDASNETRWQVLLSPKKAGNIVIPAFIIDGVSSTPIQLSVLKAGSQPQQMQNIFMRASLSNEEAYVGQMLTYTVKLYLALELQRGVLNAPDLNGAQIKQLGEDSDSTEIVNGRRYRVIERNYSIIADQPGELSITGASFAGDVLVQSRRNGAMFSFNESKPTQTQAPDIKVQIKPIPQDYHGEWLVSDLVVLKEDWPEKTVEYNIGDPITRTITLLASNTDETSLPEISLSAPAALKTYPEKAQRNTFLRENQMVAQLTQTTAIVATSGGTYTLPEIKVPWWNPHLNKQQFATLPARTIVIKGAVVAPPQPQQLQTQEPATNTSAGFWPWLSLVLALLWLVTLMLWINARKQIKAKPAAKAVIASSSPSSSFAELKVACDANNPTQVLNSISRYYTELYQRPMSLSQIAMTDDFIAKSISLMQKAAYAPVNTSSVNANSVNTSPVGSSKKPAEAVDYAKLINVVKAAKSEQQNVNTSALRQLNP
ncbi:BatD family protein [Shewanella sp. 1CM18E]|uniref:BatD family protein n=1 Tax=Shewanella sp. 1CM18E TaxID=2929169 RepID=UPI0020C06554|nr:BatD family protein [Shewanella sp. 1CM18E]